MPADYDYTGQKLDGTGFYQMGARWYDPYLDQWLQPDAIVPDPTDPQSLNRYSYVLNNPLRCTDPSGHDVGCPGEDAGECGAGSGPGVADDSVSGTTWDYSASNSSPAWSADTSLPQEAPMDWAQRSSYDQGQASDAEAVKRQCNKR